MKRAVLLVLSAIHAVALAPVRGAEPRYELFSLHSGQIGALALAFSHDGERLAVAVYGDNDEGFVRIWDVASRQELPLIPVARGAQMLAFAPDRNRLAIEDRDGTVGLWDIDSGEEVASKISLRRPYLGNCLAFSPRGEVLVWGPPAKTLQFWRLGEQGYDSPLQELKLNGVALSIAFAPDGETMVLAVATPGRRDRSRAEVQFWDVRTLTRRRSLTGYAGFPIVAFSQDGGHLCIGCREFVDVIDVASQRRLRIQAHQAPFPAGEFYPVALSPDGQVFATARSERLPVVTLWDAATGRPMTTLNHGHKAGINTMAFSPDNLHFAALIYAVGDPRGGGVHLWKKVRNTTSSDAASTRGALPSN
jgi:WD40 repeat protein